MVRPLIPNERVNLSDSTVLLVDGVEESLELLAQMFQGFGARSPLKASTCGEAGSILADRKVDLLVIDGAVSDLTGYDMIRSLRRDGGQNRYAPILLMLGHARETDVREARDCGASFVIRKPTPALVMLQRILWLSRETREFVESPGYCGPDRRFRAVGPPVGQKGRRKDDLSFEVGLATTPNLDQSDIDALFQPKRAL